MVKHIRVLLKGKNSRIRGPYLWFLDVITVKIKSSQFVVSDQDPECHVAKLMILDSCDIMKFTTMFSSLSLLLSHRSRSSFLSRRNTWLSFVFTILAWQHQTFRAGDSLPPTPLLVLMMPYWSIMRVPAYVGLLLSSLAFWSNGTTSLCMAFDVKATALLSMPSMPVAMTDRSAFQGWNLASTTTVSSPCRRTRGMSLYANDSSSSSSSKGMDDKNKNNNNDEYKSLTSPVLERVRIDGVSVSSKGFHVLVETSRRQIVPLKVTNDPSDSQQATTPESLTICQLLSGVDMAGAILPPELLSRLLVHHVEEKWQDLLDDSQADGGDNDDNANDDGNDDDVYGGRQMSSIKEELKSLLTPQEQKVLDFVKETLPEDQDFYKDATPWIQSRIRLPQATLDQLTLVPVPVDYDEDMDDTAHGINWRCRLACALPDLKDRIVVDVYNPDILAPLAFNYNPHTSLLFTCLALALRYKAPIVLEQPELSSSSSSSSWMAFPTEDILDRDFPQRTTVSKLQQQSSRVAQNIERGFEIHKLTGALQIAMRLGDEMAVERIRAKLDEYDSLQDLPTLGSTSTTASISTSPSMAMDSDQLDDGLSDDLDKNILQ
jgi:hypothetical protein